MPVTVYVPGPLRSYAGGAGRLTLAGAPATLQDALAELSSRFPGMRDRVLDEQGRVRLHVNVFVDREDVRFGAGLATPLAANAVIHILPAVSGG